MTDAIRANNSFIRSRKIAVEARMNKVIELVNCRYEEAVLANRICRESDEMLFGEAMALRDILFELEELK